MNFRRRLACVLLLATTMQLPARAPAIAAEPRAWDWPVDPPHLVSRQYRAPAAPYAPGHRGIDLDAAARTPIRSPDDGVVHHSGVVGDRPVVSIRHAGGLLSSMEPVDPLVQEGETVSRGQVIGTLGDSAGHCPDDCLHLGARLEGRYLSPLVLLGGVPRAVLLPLEGQARG